MKQVLKRAVSLTLAIIMILSCMNGIVFAAEEDAVFSYTADKSVVDASKADSNECVTLSVKNEKNTPIQGMVFYIYCDTSVFEVSDEIMDESYNTIRESSFAVNSKYGGNIAIGKIADSIANGTYLGKSGKDGYAITWNRTENSGYIDFMDIRLYVKSNALNGEYTIELDCGELSNAAEEVLSSTFSGEVSVTVENGCSIEDLYPVFSYTTEQNEIDASRASENESLNLALKNKKNTPIQGMTFYIYCDTSVFDVTDEILDENYNTLRESSVEFNTKYSGNVAIGKIKDSIANGTYLGKEGKDGYAISWSRTGNMGYGEIANIRLYVKEKALNGTYVVELDRGEVSNAAEEDLKVIFSGDVSVTVINGLDPEDFEPTIAKQPVDASYQYPATVQPLTVEANAPVATRDAELSYQWYQCNEDGSNAVEIGTNSASYTPVFNPAYGTQYYKVVVTCGEYSVESNVVAVSYAKGNLTTKEISLTSAEFTFNGSEQGPAVTVAGVDESEYVVTGNAQTNAGNYTVTVTAKADGNYTGSLTTDWEIKKADINTADKSMTIYVGGGEMNIPLKDVPAGSKITYQIIEGEDLIAGDNNFINGHSDSANASIKIKDDVSITEDKNVVIKATIENDNFFTKTVTINVTASPTKFEILTPPSLVVLPAVFGTAWNKIVAIVEHGAVKVNNEFVNGEFYFKAEDLNSIPTVSNNEIDMYWRSTSVGTNYDFYAGTITAEISPKTLTLNAADLGEFTKVYDGTENVEFTNNQVTLTGTVEGYPYSGTVSAVYADKNVGENKSVTVVFTPNAASDNYVVVINSDQVTGTITPKALTVTGVTAANKEYDGTKAATLRGTATLVGVINNEVTLASKSPAAVFAQAAPGTRIAVTTAYELVGEAKGNYTLTQPELYANITAAQMTGVEVTPYSGTYDGQEHTLTITGQPAGAVISSKWAETEEYSTGLLRKKDAGTYTLYYKVSCENYQDLTGSAVIKIEKTTPEISVQLSKTELVVGTTGTASATVTGIGNELANAAVTWSSSDPDALAINANGEMTAKELADSVTVTAQYAGSENYNAVSATATVKVVDKQLVSITATYTGGPHAHGEQVDSNKLTVTGHYDDGNSYTIDNYQIVYAGDGETFDVRQGTTQSITVKVSETMTATCEGITVTKAKITVPALTWDYPETGFYYDGSEKEVKLSNTDLNSKIIVTYTGNKQTTVGENYKASATLSLSEADAACYELVGTVAAELTWKINKASATLTTAPAANTLTYNGQAQALVTAGACTGGKMQYSLNGGTFSEDIPTAVNAGAYKVSYKVVGDENHSDVDGTEITVTIAKVAASLTTAPTATTLIYNGLEQALVTAGVCTGGTMQYSLNGSEFSTNIPTATKVGAYTVSYKVVGDENHLNSAETSVQVTIAKADPTFTVPTGLTAIYGQTLANITLPAGFAWNDATTTSVGDAGNNTFVVTYTPADTYNYNVVSNVSVVVNVAKADATEAMKTANGSLVKGSSCTVDLPVLPEGAQYGTPGFADPVVSATVADGKLTVTGSDQVVVDDVYTVKIPVTGAKNYNDYTVTVNLTGTEHEHVWTLTADKATATINAVCSGTIGNCPDAEQSVTLKAPTNLVYDGSSKIATVDGSIADKSYNITYSPESVVNVGTYTATMTMDDKSVQIQFAITAAPLTGAKVQIAEDTYTYKGEAYEPAVTVTLDGKTLTAADYDVAYTNNTNAGTATVTVTGKGNYSGSAAGTFTIAPKTVSEPTIELDVEKFEYDGKEKKPAVTVKDGTTVIPTGEYEVSYSNNVNVGTAATVTITDNADGNYIVNGTKTFEIVKKLATVATAPVANTLTYTGEEQALVKAGITNDGTLVYSLTVDGTYTEAVPIGTDAGAYTVWYKVKADANHSDSEPASVTVTIAKATPKYDVPENLTATYGDKLSQVDLPDGFSWMGGDQSVGDAGVNTAYAKFTPADTNNYEVVENIPVSIAVAKANPVYTVPTGLTAVYGETLADVELPTGFSWEDALSTSVGNYGENSFKVTYTPADTLNYNTVQNIEVKVAVRQAAAVVNKAPEAISDLIYTGAARDLVSAGSATGGTLVYSLTEDGQYNETIPTGTNAREYTVWYKVNGDSNHADSNAASVTVTIARKELTAVVAGTATKVYDGTTAVPEENTLSVSLSGVVGSDDVTATAASYAFASKDAGENQSVIATGITISGTDANNYKLKNVTANAPVGTITKATVEVSAPVAKTIGKTSVVLEAVEVNDEVTVQYGCSSDNSAAAVSNWQTGTTFNKLKPGTTYYFFARVNGEKNYADAVSGAVAIKTETDSFTVTFNTKGGSAAPEAQTVEYGGKVTEPEAPTKDDHIFMGWYVNANGTTPWSFDNGVVTKDMTLYASWEKNAFDVSGTVRTHDDKDPGHEIKITLKQGSKVYAEVMTDAAGNYKLQHVAAGTYNIVATENDGRTMTAKVKVKSDTSVDTIYLPEKNVSSEVEIPADGMTPNIVVGGLDAEAEKNAAENNTVHVTIAVEVQQKDDITEESGLSAAEKVEKDIQEEIKEEASKNDAPAEEPEEERQFTFIEISVTKTVDEAPAEVVSTTNGLIEFIIPFITEGRVDIKVHRYHGNQVDELSTTPNNDGEYIEIGDGQIIIHAKNFSTYSISYLNEVETPVDPQPPVNPQPPVSGSTSTVSVSASSAAHGTVKVSPKNAEKGDKVIITVKPDTGYAVDDVIVTSGGKVLDVVKLSATQYAFVMPSGNVRVEVTYKNAAAAIFTDVAPSAWYHDAVYAAVELGLFTGVTETTFSPEGSMTRAMLVTVLWRNAGSPTAGSSDFSDVVNGSWYDEAVAWANKEGIVTGMSADTFAPNNAITREQMATMLYRYAKYLDLNTSAKADLSAYKDADRISAYAKDAMAWAVGNGLITGMTETTLVPGGTATRAQVATILMRFVQWFGL